jgi:hypothetical protein
LSLSLVDFTASGLTPPILFSGEENPMAKEKKEINLVY